MPGRELARVETERGELVLREREDALGAVVELRANGLFVMDTRETSTERVLATASLALVADPRRVMVGGLGLGFTAREVLADPRVHRCCVVEIEPTLVEWMRQGTVPHGPAVLADERLDVVVADVAAAVREAGPASYDLLLLDVDNGPANLVHQANAALYEEPFLGAVAAMLRPGGAVAVWSAAPAPELEAALRRVLGEAASAAHPVDLQGREELYWLIGGRTTV
ncbi:hypothetical protein D9V37_02040 [Nocardioides mangrovicus]|uniref:Spermidine synthase n=1 Tax=Nocardioides mangrovicus TaxID=2478913 RepID=A0A3L8P753_9ACTN|nr:hypothetical protein [Nocardioides mangrovicus]RLV50762.1 hypothetical protein D9V37_02040 [Nocardioides mangrovicus]